MCTDCIYYSFIFYHYNVIIKYKFLHSKYYMLLLLYYIAEKSTLVCFSLKTQRSEMASYMYCHGLGPFRIYVYINDAGLYNYNC